MKDERGRENVSLLYSVACAQTICICLNGHTPLSSTMLHVFSLCIYIYLYVLQPLASLSHPFLSSSTTTTVTTINRWRWQMTGNNYNTMINVIRNNWYVKFLYSNFFLIDLLFVLATKIRNKRVWDDGHNQWVLGGTNNSDGLLIGIRESHG